MKFSMTKLENLPSLPLKKIVKCLSITEKAAFIEAASTNKNLKNKLEFLKVERRKFCPYCILGLGIQYESLIYGPKRISIGEQLLNSSSGDSNWKWINERQGRKLQETNGTFEYQILIRIHRDESVVNIIDLLCNQENDENSKQKLQLVMNEFLSLYIYSEKAKVVRVGFSKVSDLLEHILSDHREWLLPNQYKDNKNDENILKFLFRELSLKECPVIQIDHEHGTFNRLKTIQYIFPYIVSNIFMYNEIYNDALALPLKDETNYGFFMSQVCTVFKLSAYTIESTLFCTENGQTNTEYMFIRRLLKTFTVCSTIFYCLSQDYNNVFHQCQI